VRALLLLSSLFIHLCLTDPPPLLSFVFFPRADVGSFETAMTASPPPAPLPTPPRKPVVPSLSLPLRAAGEPAADEHSPSLARRSGAADEPASVSAAAAAPSPAPVKAPKMPPKVPPKPAAAAAAEPVPTPAPVAAEPTPATAPAASGAAPEKSEAAMTVKERLKARQEMLKAKRANDLSSGSDTSAPRSTGDDVVPFESP